MGNLEVYFDPAVSMEEKIIFSKYVHEHLLQHARDVERLRHHVCPECGTPVGNREVAMKRLNDWLRGRPPQPEATGFFKLRKKKEETPSIICVGCEQRVPLWDEMEQCFASPEIQQRVRDMQEESAIELGNQSKERALVGEAISTVALADQISREFKVRDQGIDMEIEFNDDAHAATGAKPCLQLKSGDSYTRKRRGDGSEIFTLKKRRHAEYWMAQAFPVLLVIRNSEGEVRWMEVRDWLKRGSDNGKKPVKQIVFEGERFDVLSVWRWREKVLKVNLFVHRSLADGLEAQAVLPAMVAQILLREPRGEVGGLEFVEVVDGEVGGGEFVGGVGGGDADDAHAAGAGGGDTDMGVLEDHAALGRAADARGGGEENLGVGFAVGDILGGDDAGEKFRESDEAEREVDVCAVCGGADGAGHARVAQTLQPGADAGQRGEPALGHDFAVERFFAQ